MEGWRMDGEDEGEGGGCGRWALALGNGRGGAVVAVKAEGGERQPASSAICDGDGQKYRSSRFHIDDSTSNTQL